MAKSLGKKINKNVTSSHNFEICFHHTVWDDPAKVRKRIALADEGPHIFFRRIKTGVQAALAQLLDHSEHAQVFLCGSPHIDNYARTNTGCGMIDFDRAHNGPYSWDLVCLMMSISLRQQAGPDAKLSNTILDSLLAGYHRGLDQPELGFAQYQPLLKKSPKKWQCSSEAYLAANKKWIGKARKGLLEHDDPLVQTLLEQYFLHRGEVDWQQYFKLSEVGQTSGTFGRIHYIFVLAHCHSKFKSNVSNKQHLILDIKHAKSYSNPNMPHLRWYNHDFFSEGQRMIAASHLYAPGVTARESFAIANGIEFWAREVPTINLKIKGLLSEEQTAQFAYAVANQLGRGHGLTLQNIHLIDFKQQLEEQFPSLVESTFICQQALLNSWIKYQELYQATHE